MRIESRINHTLSVAIDFGSKYWAYCDGVKDEHGTRNANGQEPVFFLDFVMTHLVGRFSCSQ